MSTRKLQAILLGFLILPWGEVLAADDVTLLPGAPPSHPLPPPPPELRPLGAVRASLLSGYPQQASLSATLSRWRPLEVEVGVWAEWLDFEEPDTGVNLRAGLWLPLVNRRDGDGRGWVVGAQALVGVMKSDWSCGRYPNCVSLTINPGIEATRWRRPHRGLSLHLTSGAALALNQAPAAAPDIRLSMGVAF